ncbi:phosphotransferase [Corynebacterium breve]|uniref:Phosphotransferase n=1 Tax=Corynebacterium breve TaxID=3049799 RepID=A0ABY8VFW6_9CORY|nr:phosphotransferase [Corynebacterium breve]WIM67114.1 phosphotransferase [Corynebacterium breve]
MDLSQERFYGAKSEPIDSVDMERSCPTGVFQWQILRVAHGDTVDLYQVLYDETTDHDCLNSDDGAAAYLAHASSFGEIHGDFSGTAAEPLGADQSNTSLIVDDDWMVKVYRKLEPGVNPDVELLSAIGDCPNVAGVRGHVSYELNGKPYTLAMMQQRIKDGKDGFDLAQATEDFGDLACELGKATRTVHDHLARAFGTETVTMASIGASLNQHLDELLPQAPQLAELEDTIRAFYHQLSGTDVEIQRIHGDLHLGQTLRTGDRWYLIDFEGEPARPLEQRVLPDHRARDIAGMVRSIGYVAALSERDQEWEQAIVDKYLSGYGPIDRDLLAAYVIDKAAYEVVYEANNRPELVDVPLRAITTLTQG